MLTFLSLLINIIKFWANLYFLVNILNLISLKAGWGNLYGSASKILFLSLCISLAYHAFLHLRGKTPDRNNITNADIKTMLITRWTMIFLFLGFFEWVSQKTKNVPLTEPDIKSFIHSLLMAAAVSIIKYQTAERA